MPIFSDAQNTVISDAHFTDYGTTQNVGFQLNVGLEQSGGIKLLLQASVPGASHDSAARVSPPRCFPGTRTKYIDEITAWALGGGTHDQQRPPILWTKGPAGVGKTALAQTCVEQAKDAGVLGAAFFFSSWRSGCHDHRRLFTSLAYQISTIFRPYRDLLDDKIKRDETLVSKSLVWQFEELIAGPFEELARDGICLGGRVIFIDGLDECVGADAQVEIIQTIVTSVRRRSTPFRWAIFSRPEPHITAALSREEISPLCLPVSLSVSRQVDGEIRAVLRSGFNDILRRHNLSTVSLWPSEQVLDTLVNAAAGLFIFAATILRFVGESGKGSPDELLQMVILAITRKAGGITAGASSANPFEALDAFYRIIMQQIPADMLPLTQLLLLLTNFAPQTQHGWVAMQLGNFLGMSEMAFTLICNKLHAVLLFQDHQHRTIRHDTSQPAGLNCINHLQSSGESNRLAPVSSTIGGSISFYHKSFADFLNDPDRSGKFCIWVPKVANQLFSRCLEIHDEYKQSYSFPDIELQSLLLPSDSLPPWSIPKHRLPFLRLADGVTSSASSLKWPHLDECMNAFLKIHVYRLAIEVIIQLHLLFPLDHTLLQRLEDLDYRQMFRIYSTGDDELDIRMGSIWDRNLTVGHESSSHSDASYLRLFEEIRQKLPIELQRGKIIRTYTPSLASKWKSVFHRRISPNLEGKVHYILGHGDNKLFVCQSHFTEYLTASLFWKA